MRFTLSFLTKYLKHSVYFIIIAQINLPQVKCPVSNVISDYFIGQCKFRHLSH